MRTLIGLTCSLAMLAAAPALAQQKKSPPPGTPQAQKEQSGQPQGPTATASMRDQQGRQIGTVKLEQGPRGVVVSVSLSGLTPGPHAFHIHEVGKCEPPFTSAGGHFNPTGREHGIHNPKGMHAGDLPNLHADQSGNAKFEEFLVEGVSLEPGKPGYLFDEDGSAFIVHASADDYRSDPAGNAGDRIACGVVEKGK
jgi:Cu-Zn family superoxide dismutase